MATHTHTITHTPIFTHTYTHTHAHTHTQPGRRCSSTPSAQISPSSTAQVGWPAAAWGEGGAKMCTRRVQAGLQATWCVPGPFDCLCHTLHHNMFCSHAGAGGRGVCLHGAVAGGGRAPGGLGPHGEVWLVCICFPLAYILFVELIEGLNEMHSPGTGCEYWLCTMVVLCRCVVRGVCPM